MERISPSNYNFTSKARGERSLIIGDIYEVYLQDGVSRKKLNWKKYVEWLKENRFKDTKENQLLFKKSKFFCREWSISALAYRLSHLKKNEDLYYILSVCKDKLNRGESVGGYLYWLSTSQSKDKEYN